MNDKKFLPIRAIPNNPPRWKVIVEDPDGTQVYSGEGLDALTRCTQQFDADEIRAIYIYD